MLLLCNFVNCQYYVRGEVRDEKGKLLPDAKIFLKTKGTFPYTSGNNGFFGIALNTPTDTITLIYDGYEVLKRNIDAREYQVLNMKMLPSMVSMMKNRLTSNTTNFTTDQNNFSSAFGESYSSLIENSFINASFYPETGFALNIDRASYSNIRRFIMNEMNVPADAVRIEEMLNYFNLKIDNNNNQSHFSCKTKVTGCPWNTANKLFFINITAPKLNLDSIPASNLVFLIDVSGSMDRPNRLPLLQSAFKLLVENLRIKDTISIVTYGGGVHVQLNKAGGAEKDKINNIIDSLYADGDTPGEGAIRTAYYIAKKAFIKNGNNRIILATDGDFNVGQSSEKELEDMIVFEKQSGIYLTCIGVGMGNYKDSKLETLAKKGNGNFAYLDNIGEAEKVLVTEFTKTIYAVANDAYLNVDFNKDVVKDYRLIGFDNKKEAVNDSSSILQGGEVGSGHNMMAIFEITPQTDIRDSLNNSIADLHLQYHLPANETPIYQNFKALYSPESFDTAPAPVRFATSVAMLGTLLRNSKFGKLFNYEKVYAIAAAAADINSNQQQQFLSIIKKSEKIYNYKKKKSFFN
jgi:Ca-activated chloride channel family protein